MTYPRMPALFLGHGSPMNVLEDNRYTQGWRQLGDLLPRPKAIVMISAHWCTQGTAVTAMEKPRTIHDFGGFPQALYDMRYPAPGSPELARRIADLLAPTPIIGDQAAWGFDHGAWGVMIKMYPQADIPMVQISLDQSRPAAWHYEQGKRLAALRDEGILLAASGNVVHNLRAVRWQAGSEPYSWATSFNDYVKNNLTWQGPAEQHPLVNAMQHEEGVLANPTPEHYLPLLYILGSWNGKEPVTVPLEGIEMGSLSMLSVQVG